MNRDSAPGVPARSGGGDYALPSPITASQDLDRYELTARREIIAILRDVLESRTPVTAYYGADFLPTRILAINPDFEELVLDAARDARGNGQLSSAAHLTFVTFEHRVKIQWTAPAAELVLFDDLPAFRSRLPERIVRLQRRNYYRIATPIANPLTCKVPRPGAAGAPVVGTIADISCGGFSMLVPPGSLEPELGGLYHDCELILPGTSLFGFALEVRNLNEEWVDGRLRGLRLRCKFRGLPEGGEALIQRYINQLERERRERR